MNGVIYAYLITNIVNGKRYVGVTTKSDPLVRWSQHIGRARKGERQHYLANAIRKHGAENFEFRVVAEAYSPAEAIRLERGLIAQYGTFWPNGYNLTNGGEGNVGFITSSATKAKQSAAANERNKDEGYLDRLRAGVAERDKNPDYHRRRSEAQRRPEVRAKRSEISKALMADPARRQRISESTTAAFASPEVRAERKRLRKEQWQVPGFKEKHAAAMAAVQEQSTAKRLETMAKPEVRERMSQAQKVGWENNPERKIEWAARQRRVLNNPETKRKMSEAAKLRNAKRYANKAPKPEPKARANPEYLANQSAKAKAEWAKKKADQLANRLPNSYAESAPLIASSCAGFAPVNGVAYSFEYRS